MLRRLGRINIKFLSSTATRASSSTAQAAPSAQRRRMKRAHFKETEAARPEFEDETFSLTRTPQVGWTPATGLNKLPTAAKFEPSTAQFRSINPDDVRDTVYKLMVSAITPRPIAFMSTMSADGQHNLAPMSFFNMVAHDPPTIMVSIQANPKGKGGLKDTNENIRETKEFCTSIISEPFVEAANYTSIDSPHGVDEWALSGLTPRKSEVVRPPHVAESAFSMECELVHWHDIKNDEGVVGYTVILGRVRRFHVKESVIDPNDPMKVMTEELRPVSRLGGLSFGRTIRGFDLERPRWDEVKDTEAVTAALAKGKE